MDDGVPPVSGIELPRDVEVDGLPVGDSVPLDVPPPVGAVFEELTGDLDAVV